MVDSHIQSFFGQSTGVIVKSHSKSKPTIFFQCLKKKSNGIWEKPSLNEGKIIKFSLEEVVMILQVLNRKLVNWINYHSYQNRKTQISFSWEDKNADVLWINIGDYSKMLNFSQTEILRLLLTHLLNEKIVYSSNTIIKNKNIHKEEKRENSDIDNCLETIEDQTPIKNTPLLTQIEGLIKSESTKAILIEFSSDKKIWIPKSTIHSEYNPRKNSIHIFLVENWILRKNNLIS